jgi:hypothetical protein
MPAVSSVPSSSTPPRSRNSSPPTAAHALCSPSRLPDRRVTADLNAKSVRKAVATISEHGPDGVAVIIQGKLVGDAITEAGIVAQPKAKPQAVAA